MSKSTNSIRKNTKSIVASILVIVLVASGAFFLKNYIGWTLLPNPKSSLAIRPNTWQKYNPICKALADNLQIYTPTSWEVSKEFPVYDGGDFSSPQKVKDFYNLVSHCQIVVGFGSKPDSYQDSHEGDRGVIYVAVQDIDVPTGLKVTSKSDKLTTINGRPFLVTTSDIGGSISKSWITITKSHYKVEIYLEINHPDYNSNDLNTYMTNTAEEMVQRIVVK